MPFLRVLRDKRGYETTYLIHAYQDGPRQRSRVLYMFRTPGGVQVGRAPLEPDVLRDIEIQHPEIAFDWKAVVDSRQVIESTPDPRRTRKRRDGEEERAPAAKGPDSAPSGAGRRDEAGTAAPLAPPVPSQIEGSAPDEQTAFLALWYPIVRDRIVQRASDPVRCEALMALAEHLNPVGWTDADQVTTGLRQAAESLERLAQTLSRRRRRPRRTPGRPATASAVDGATVIVADVLAGESEPDPGEFVSGDLVTDGSPEEE